MFQWLKIPDLKQGERCGKRKRDHCLRGLNESDIMPDV